jgi:hypothetical protein
VGAKQAAKRTTTLNLHAWLCDCGEHRTTEGMRASRIALEAHLAGSGHPRGEYYYGCQGQRTSVAVTADPDGRFSHHLLSG